MRVLDSQAYKKMNVTRERIRYILELTAQAGNECCCCLCCPEKYLRLGTLVSYTLAQVTDWLVTVSSFCPFTLN